MADNPLMVQGAQPKSRWHGTVDKFMIDDYVAQINKANFVRLSGMAYFTNKKHDLDGKAIYFLDRYVTPPHNGERA